MKEKVLGKQEFLEILGELESTRRWASDGYRRAKLDEIAGDTGAVDRYLRGNDLKGICVIEDHRGAEPIRYILGRKP